MLSLRSLFSKMLRLLLDGKEKIVAGGWVYSAMKETTLILN